MPSLYIAAVAVLIALIALSLAACLREERQAKRRPAAQAPLALPRPPAAPTIAEPPGAPVRSAGVAAGRAGASVVPFPAGLERRAPGEADLAAVAALLQQQAAALEAEREALRSEIRQLRRALADGAARGWAAPQPAAAPVRLVRVG